MLHYHQGSQIPKVSTVRLAAQEAARVYANLVKEGAPMGLLNLGGGLAVDYSGRKMADENSMNYTMREYCADIWQAKPVKVHLMSQEEVKAGLIQ
jgi:arginine decarboxylase